jgi:hypothetical protein
MSPYWQRNQDSKAWLRRWEEKRRRAFDGGQIDHSKDKSAPWSHPAHYGYLVPLTGAALEAYKGWKIRTGNTETSDAVRWAFEDWYIGICRDEMKKTATRAKATDSYMEYRQKQNKKRASV